MKISLSIDADYDETKILIETSKLDESVQEILDFLKGLKMNWMKIE